MAPKDVKIEPESLRRSAGIMQECGNDSASALNDLLRQTDDSADAWGDDAIGVAGHRLFDGVRKLALRFDAEMASGLTDISYGLYRVVAAYEAAEEANARRLEKPR